MHKHCNGICMRLYASSNVGSQHPSYDQLIAHGGWLHGGWGKHLCATQNLHGKTHKKKGHGCSAQNAILQCRNRNVAVQQAPKHRKTMQKMCWAVPVSALALDRGHRPSEGSQILCVGCVPQSSLLVGFSLFIEN